MDRTVIRGPWIVQEPLNIWTEHSNCQIHSRGDSKTHIALPVSNIFLNFFCENTFNECKSLELGLI